MLDVVETYEYVSKQVELGTCIQYTVTWQAIRYGGPRTLDVTLLSNNCSPPRRWGWSLGGNHPLISASDRKRAKQKRASPPPCRQTSLDTPHDRRCSTSLVTSSLLTRTKPCLFRLFDSILRSGLLIAKPEAPPQLRCAGCPNATTAGTSKRLSSHPRQQQLPGSRTIRTSAARLPVAASLAMDTNMEDVGRVPADLPSAPTHEPATIPTLDGWIESLMNCKQLAEQDVMRLCEKASLSLSMLSEPLAGERAWRAWFGWKEPLLAPGCFARVLLPLLPRLLTWSIRRRARFSKTNRTYNPSYVWSPARCSDEMLTGDDRNALLPCVAISMASSTT